MTSRQAHDGTRWVVAPVAGPVRRPDPAAGPATFEPEPATFEPEPATFEPEPAGFDAGFEAEPAAVPEASDLPPDLARGVRALVDLIGPTVSYTVDPEPESVTEARHFAVTRVIGWGTPALAGDVGLVVSELVTNALRHGTAPAIWGGTSRAPRNGHGSMFGAPSSGIRLRLLHHAPWLLCGIMDSSTAAPRRREPDYIAETGRGLHLVESFTTRWGWCGLPRGKVVWALFRSP